MKHYLNIIIIFTIFSLWGALSGLVEAAESNPEELVWDYFEYFAHKDIQSILNITVLSEHKEAQLRADLEAVFDETINIGIVPVVKNVTLDVLKATVMVDVKMLLFDDELTLSEAEGEKTEFEKQFSHMMFELDIDSESNRWAITNVYSKAIDWPVPPECDDQLTVYSMMPVSDYVMDELDRLVDTFGNLAEIHSVIALKWMEWNEPNKAQEVCEIILNQEPKNFYANILLADLLYKSGQKDQARKHALEAIRFSPFMQNPNQHVMVGYVLVGTGEVDQGLKHLQLYLKRSPRGAYADSVHEVVNGILEIKGSLGALEILTTVDGAIPEDIQISLYRSGSKELIDMGRSSPMLVSRLFPGLYDISCIVQGVSVWDRNIKILPTQTTRHHLKLETGIISVEAFKALGLPLLGADIFLFLESKETYIQRLRGYSGEFRVLPGKYDMLIRSAESHVLKKISNIEVGANETVSIKHNFYFQKVSIKIDDSGQKKSFEAYVVAPDRPDEILKRFDSRKASVFLLPGGYQLWIKLGDDEKWVDFDVESDIECNLHIVLNQ